MFPIVESSLNTETCHDANFVIIGGPGGYHNDNHQRHQWPQSWCHDSSRFSVNLKHHGPALSRPSTWSGVVVSDPAGFRQGFITIIVTSWLKSSVSRLFVQQRVMPVKGNKAPHYCPLHEENPWLDSANKDPVMREALPRHDVIIHRRLCHYSVISINSLWPGDVIWRQRSKSTLAQVMTCCLTAPSHYRNQCWLMIREVLWRSPDSDLTPQGPMS